jgi:hypothetical protein
LSTGGDCLNHATEADEFGIWGGLGQRERRNIRHETDHLDGVLFIDRMDAATRKLATREIRAS